MLLIRVSFFFIPRTHKKVLLIFFKKNSWYYEIGIGVPRDFQQAHYYYAKACKKGNHKQAQDRVDLLEGMVKHQRNEKRRTVIQDKRRSSQGNPLKTSRDSQCNIM